MYVFAMEGNPSTWSEEHRLAISIVAAASAVMIAFGFLSIGKYVKQPFEPEGGRFVSLDEQEAEAEAALKLKDTDGDQLTDYDELRIYHTSPYLEDTDSDTYLDGVELKSGDDPNCPRGQVCQTSAAYVAPAAKLDPNDALMGAPTLLDPSLLAGTSSGVDISVLTQFDAAKVRALLKSAGMSDAQLSKITDDQLRQIYDEALADEVSTSTLERLDKASAKTSQ